MADIISRLKLESGEFDSKIKRAGQELLAYSEHCKKTGLQMGFANKDAKEFAKALGNMQTTSTTARGKINELSDAFVNLKVMYKQMTDEEKNNPFGKNLAASLDQLKTRIQDAKKDLADVTAELNIGKGGGGVGLFSGGGMSGMLQVFGGNMMTKAAGMAANLGMEMADMVQQGIEMARQGEGIRVAFERLGRGDILDGLRQATHGTVTDLELMKAAVKFNDFKLPLDELGTMLAFAQQKAKDTGQSVDYMVDSIVTGLGRKSLMILDNLGLSATEIKDKMAETGDMTSAVGAIIREQMQQAGDYVETAAERATASNVELQNAMENLGRTLLPLQEQGASMWTSLETGALNLLNEGLTPIVPKVIELKDSISDLYETISGSTVFSGLVDWMETGVSVASTFIPQLQIIRNLLNFGQGNAAGAGAAIGGAIASNIPDYQEVADIGEVVVKGNRKNRPTGGSRTRKPSFLEQQQSAWDKVLRFSSTENFMNDLRGGAPAPMMSPFQMLQAQHQQELSGIRLDSRSDFEEGRQRAMSYINEREEYQKDPFKEEKKQLAVMDDIAGNIGNIMSGIQNLGIELPEGLTELISGIQSVISIISSIMSLVTLISTLQTVKATPVIGWALAGGGVIGGSRGRKFLHAAGGIVAGNTYSNDQIPAMLNAGEVVLNRAQASTLASQLQGGGMQGAQLEAVVTGEQLRFVLNTNSRRRGKGEYVTSNKR